jgi:hypothetical protein
MGIQEDFESAGPVRYAHHTLRSGDIYFVSNKTDDKVNALCTFRVNDGTPELWDPLTGETRLLPDFEAQKERMQIALQFEPYQSYFVVFNRNRKGQASRTIEAANFSIPEVLLEVNSPWKVSFDPAWGGPDSIVFDQPADWTTRHEEGIKYYSGIAVYQNTVSIPENIVADKKSDIFLNLGEVYNLARIRINGKDMGVVWTPPWQLKITDAIVSGNNRIEIEVANLWPNRLIGDEQLPDDGIKEGLWPDWLLKKLPRTSGRYTFTTRKFYQKDSELLKSGLIGPVRILIQKQ